MPNIPEVFIKANALQTKLKAEQTDPTFKTTIDAWLSSNPQDQDLHF